MASSRFSPASVPMSSGDDTKPYACTICVQRKVKCDKRQPCLSCLKSRLQCQYRTAPPPQRRKRKADNSNPALLNILQSHEAALRAAGVTFEPFDYGHEGGDDHDEGAGETTENQRGPSLPAATVSGSTPIRTQRPRRGILISEHGGKRYYENGLLGSLGKEYRQDPINHINQHDMGSRSQPEMIAASILSGLPSTQAGLRYQHPPAAVVVKYWSIFIENVHPLTKIVHGPTMYQMITDSTLNPSKNTEALRFSIYACAVASLTDRECQRLFSQENTFLLRNFQSATRNALLESSFLRVPDIDLLRAHLLLLTSMLHTSDASSLWILMGSAIRMAQSQGLHRDGAALGLPPFEIEMRRRLWWYIVTLDGRLTELTGSETCLPKSADTLLPSNFNDADLQPEMATIPEERVGASEMTFCLMKHEMARFLQENNPPPKPNDNVHKGGERRSVSDLEGFLEEKFLRFCDPVIAVQFLTTTVARSALCKVRQMMHHRRPRTNFGRGEAPPRNLEQTPQSNRTLHIATRNLEYDNLMHSSKSLRGFLWQVNFDFPWGAPIFILRNLASHSSQWDESMQAAWTQIEELYEHHPEFIGTDKVVHLIVGGLTLKAWTARETYLESRGMRERQQPPAFITTLQSRHAVFLSRNNDERLRSDINEENHFVDFSGFDASTMTNFDVDAMFSGVDLSDWGDH